MKHHRGGRKRKWPITVGLIWVSAVGLLRHNGDGFPVCRNINPIISYGICILADRISITVVTCSPTSKSGPVSLFWSHTVIGHVSVTVCASEYLLIQRALCLKVYCEDESSLLRSQSLCMKGANVSSQCGDEVFWPVVDRWVKRLLLKYALICMLYQRILVRLI